MPSSRPGLWWTAAATATVLGAAFWLRAPSTGLLIACTVTTLLSVILTFRGDRALNRIGFAIAASAFVLIVGWAQRTSAGLAEYPNAARAALAARGTAAIAAALDAETAALQRLAVEALDAHADPRRAFADLDKLRGPSPARSVVLIRGGTPFAWSGRLMTPLDSLVGPVGAWPTPFYLAIYAIAGRGSDRAVAEVLVHADPPGNVLAQALDAQLAAKYGVERFDYRSPTDTSGDSLTVVRAAGVPVLAVRSIAPPGALLATVALERGRSRGGIALALATLFFLAATWRERGGVTGRLAALAVALAAVALVPLARFSNASTLFDPTYFYVATGGPFTGSVGALALTCSLVLLGMLAALRARVGTQSRMQAIAAVAIVAGVGPFLLRDLARGIQFPEAGVSMAMWLAWESTLFLASVSVLMAGATAGQAALGARRGLPLWIAPAIAGVAAIFAPALMDAPGAFPPWYPALWVVAIGALAFARRARAAVLPVAVVAACGAVTLVWGQSVRSRVLLAERDVGSLNTLDSSAAMLLQRFTAQLDVSHAPATRVELLARYAASDLASGDYPVELTSWSPTGVPIADLLVGKAEKTEHIEYFASQAQDSTHAVFSKVLGWPGLYLVLSVPHEDRSVTTVVVAPRTRLLARDAFGALMGLGPAQTTDPPYTLSLGGVRHNALFTNEAQWERHGDELHGDRFLPDKTGGFTVVHASVQLRGFNQLIMRGSLVVVLDLLALLLLWLLLVIADGAFGRWMRIQRRRWLRSYRAKLTLALFAFFVIPAGVFAAWSYQRLRSDDDQARNLLVRETLRGAAIYTDSTNAKLADIAAKFQTPLFLYADGILKAASDSVFDALAPLGRLLPPSSALTLGEGDEITSSSDETVGSQPMLFGFRGSNTDASPVQFVLAAPARTDDLALDQRRRDLGILVLFAAVIGAVAALWLSELAARQFSRPIRTLQAGVLALAAGEREPQLSSDPPVEFQPVFTAFRQMAHDIEAGRDQEAHAQRVLAWGEMARQVAHEIKNPLTPMRLGMQHLRRARHDPNVDFDRVLDENVTRVLSEIDRLDEIARAFSRYGTAPDDRTPAVPVDLAEAVGDVMQLERLGGEDVRWSSAGGESPMLVLAGRAEIREVLLNLLENARLASARNVSVTLSRSDDRVRVTVLDDGQGIAGDVMPRIFEPHFSTRTSGSGLGLAISRRLVEGWGGTIRIDSAPGEGTTVHIALVPAPAT
ncbi:MAG TPA: HAMP domain-containing sensor histidine kinase [Gemmatimonadaceae bacterium]